MNKQEIFNKVYLGLKGQSFVKSTDLAGNCKYRGANGTKCAIGHLIPDEQYHPCLEKVCGYEIAVWLGIPCLSEEMNLALSLQRAHDLEFDLQVALEKIAKQYKLTVPE
jgi:hypothetical protein